MFQCKRKPNARAVIRGNDDHPELCGEALFYQEKDAVLVVARIFGLPRTKAGFFGFHIHEGGSCSGKGFADTGGHDNPGERPHPSHAGDLPPLLSCKGNAYLAVRTDRFRVREILGKTVVIHGGTDDFRSQPSGDAGEKIACGVIRAQ